MNTIKRFVRLAYSHAKFTTTKTTLEPTYKSNSVSKLFLKNENMVFQDEKSTLEISTGYPEIVYKSQEVFDLKKDILVLYFRFTSKPNHDNKNPLTET